MTPYTTTRKPDGSTVVMVGTKAAKRVKQDASPTTVGGPLRWRSLAGETFGSLDEVAESMRWAL